MLKSGAEAPLRVQVSKLFRVGPVPQKASSQDVQASCQGPRARTLVGWATVDPPSVFPPSPLPIERRFQDQESRLSALEQTLQGVKQDQAAFRAEVQDSRAKDMHSIVGALDTKLTRVQTDLAQQLQTSITSLVAAQSQQQASMQAGIEELRSLIVNSGTFHKRPKTDEDGA